MRFMRPGESRRVQGDTAFTLHRSSDNWKTIRHTPSTPNALQIDYVDVDLQEDTTSSGVCIRFTFLWAENSRWEGQDYAVTVQ